MPETFEPTHTMQAIWAAHIRKTPVEKISSRVRCAQSYVLEVIVMMERRARSCGGYIPPKPAAVIKAEKAERQKTKEATASEVKIAAKTASDVIKDKIRQHMTAHDRRVLKALYDAPAGLRAIDIADRTGIDMTTTVRSLSAILTEAGAVTASADKSMWMVSDRTLADELLNDGSGDSPICEVCIRIIREKGQATAHAIRAITQIPETTIKRTLKKLAAAGRIERRRGARGGWQLSEQATK